MKLKLFCFFSFSLVILSVDNSLGSTFKPDSLFLKPFSRKLSIRSMTGIKEFSITIGNNPKIGEQSQRITYKPNNGILGGLGISYKNVLLSYFFKIPGTEMNSDRFGSTSIADYQINVTTRFIFLSGYHRSFNGFYVARPKESYPDWEAGTPNPQRPDINYLTKGLETIISFNPRKYSLNASLKFTEQQVKSVFSTLLYANLSYLELKGDSSLVPSHLKDSFFEGKELIKGDFSGWSLQPGVAYSLINKRWIFNPMIFAGFGYFQKNLLFSDQETKSYKDYYFRISTKLNCGYNSRLFFSGILVEWNQIFLPEKNLIIRTENFNVMLIAGFRF